MAFSLIPREAKFFDLFDATSDVIRRSAEKFFALVSEFDRLAERGAALRAEQSACNEIVRQTIAAAEDSFITPFDRENIHSLTNAANDLVEMIEESAGRFEVFRVQKATDEAILLAGLLRDCCFEGADALRLCRQWKNAPQIMDKVREILRIERTVEHTRRDFDRALFSTPSDPVELVKWRELYRSISDAVKAARRVGQCLSEIVVKGG